MKTKMEILFLINMRSHFLKTIMTSYSVRDSIEKAQENYIEIQIVVIPIPSSRRWFKTVEVL